VYNLQQRHSSRRKFFFKMKEIQITLHGERFVQNERKPNYASRWKVCSDRKETKLRFTAKGLFRTKGNQITLHGERFVQNERKPNYSSRRTVCSERKETKLRFTAKGLFGTKGKQITHIINNHYVTLLDPYAKSIQFWKC